MDSPFLEPPSLMDGGTYLPCVPPAIFALSTPGAPPACWASSSAFSSPWIQHTKPGIKHTHINNTLPHTHVLITMEIDSITAVQQEPLLMANSYDL